MDDLKDKIGQRYKKLEQEIDREYRNEKEDAHAPIPHLGTRE